MFLIASTDPNQIFNDVLTYRDNLNRPYSDAANERFVKSLTQLTCGKVTEGALRVIREQIEPKQSEMPQLQMSQPLEMPQCYNDLLAFATKRKEQERLSETHNASTSPRTNQRPEARHRSGYSPQSPRTNQYPEARHRPQQRVMIHQYHPQPEIRMPQYMPPQPEVNMYQAYTTQPEANMPQYMPTQPAGMYAPPHNKIELTTVEGTTITLERNPLGYFVTQSQQYGSANHYQNSQNGFFSQSHQNRRTSHYQSSSSGQQVGRNQINGFLSRFNFDPQSQGRLNDFIRASTQYQEQSHRQNQLSIEDIDLLLGRGPGQL